MAKKRKKRKNQKFKIGFRVYISVLCILVVACLVVLWNKLSDYQKGLDEAASIEAHATEVAQAPQLAFEAYLENMTPNDWLNAWKTCYPYSLDSDETILDYINTHILTVDYSLFRSPDYTDDTPSYLLRSGDMDLAIFRMAGSDTTYQVSSIEIPPAATQSITVSIPSGCILMCNQNALGEQFVIATSSSVNVPGYNDVLTGIVSSDIYSLEGLISEPTLSISSSSEGVYVSQDKNSNYYLAIEGSEAGSYKNQAEAFIRELLHYYDQGKNGTDVNINSVLNLTVSGSEAAKIIHSSYDGVIWRPAESHTYSISSSDVFRLADNCYCVDVSYVCNDSEESETYRIYFLNLGSGFKIYSFELY